MTLLLIVAVFSLFSRTSAEELKKVAFFTSCFKTHIRQVFSIAKELSLRPHVNVTVTIHRKCEDYVKKLNLNVNIEVVSSVVDDWELDDSDIKQTKEYYCLSKYWTIVNWI